MMSLAVARGASIELLDCVTRAQPSRIFLFAAWGNSANLENDCNGILAAIAMLIDAGRC